MEKFAYYRFKDFNARILKIGYINDQLSSLSIVDTIDSNNELSDFSDYVFFQLEAYFKGERRGFDLSIHMQGTDFQKKVWKALQEIPYGQTRTYKQIAEYIGSPKAYRAVGMANNKNPLMIVIPCHRVIGSNGSLTGYAGGLDIKEELLTLENPSNHEKINFAR